MKQPNIYHYSVQIGPLQLAILVEQKRQAGTQKSHWDKTKKGNYHLKLCLPFVGLTPERILRPRMAVFYHVYGKLQRAYISPLIIGCHLPQYPK